MSDLVLPTALEVRLASLPEGLRNHINRVRDIARDLAGAHAIDQDLAELTAAAHDVARHIPGRHLIEEAERMGFAVNAVERRAPILLHGPVGAGWLAEEAALDDPSVLEGVRWHTTAHPDLSPVGQVVFIADKLDPHKAKAYPFQDTVRSIAYRDLHEGALTFLDGMLKMHLDRGDLVHPASIDSRNALILGALGC